MTIEAMTKNQERHHGRKHYCLAEHGTCHVVYGLTYGQTCKPYCPEAYVGDYIGEYVDHA
ncbi:hypothetical protein MASR2M48_26910 [Spirochaetota bacterium]